MVLWYIAQNIGSSCYWKELISSSSYTVLLMAVYLNHICSNRVIGVQWNLSNTDGHLWNQNIVLICEVYVRGRIYINLRLSQVS